jgi:hypothetical protein
MISEIKIQFQSMIEKIVTFKRNDILCHIDNDHVIFLSEISSKKKEFSAINKKSKEIEKETGINPLCKSFGLIELKSSEGQTNCIPIFLQEVQVKISDDEYIFIDVGEKFLNPYLYFKLELSHEKREINSFEELKIINSTKDFSIQEDVCLVGNFHPYRFEIYRDLSEISESNQISVDLARLFMLENNLSEANFDWISKPILPLNYDQKKTLEILKSHSVLVHGPPGTGKSQLIANAIGFATSSNLSVIMSSEKKASLDAVYKRLQQAGLHPFCLINYSKNEIKKMIRDLKKTWDFLSKEYSYNHFDLEPKYPYFKMVNELISKPKKEDLNLKKLIANLQNLDNAIISNNLDFREFLHFEHFINSLDKDLFRLTRKLNFNQEWDEKNLIKYISNCKKIISGISVYHPVNTIADIDQLTRNLLIIQGFSTTIYQKYGALICNKPKKIKQLFTESLKIEKKGLKWESKLNHWIKTPSIEEIELLKFMALKKRLTDRIKFNRTWKKWVRTKEIDPISACDEMLEYLNYQKDVKAFSLKLEEFGIQTVQDLKLIADLIKTHSAVNWNWYRELDENLKQNAKKVHSDVSTLKNILNEHFNFNFDDQINIFFDEIFSNKELIFDELLIIEKLPSWIRESLQNCSNIQDLYDQFHLSLWKNHFGNLEIPTRLVQKEWIQSALRYEKSKSEVLKMNSIAVIQNIKNKFDSYHKLIDTPNQKLSLYDQKKKAELKIGKRILIKEFGKSKQHLNLRKLYESEAKHWLIVLKPILMMHPLRIATYFPSEQGLFDLGIIDEASQMPFKNSIGTIQRAKRILIAGDENQMDPSYFFSSNDNEHSVFHQAKYHLKNIELTHHYRSESEELISFSNRYFYENKLRFVEYANSVRTQCLTHHFVKNGNYEDGINENEAQTVANFIVNFLKNDWNQLNIGVVAFSESQLKSIIQKIPLQLSTIIQDLEDSNRIFFKTLDQVQGDECDCLIISFGYGKNKDGKFEMRFGPINQVGGEKRLNVLFSRAKKEIHFFSSVKYADFTQSKNESVNLLKQWFALLEQSRSMNIKSYEIHVLDILEQAKDVDDFTHLIALYHDRGWKIETT